MKKVIVLLSLFVSGLMVGQIVNIPDANFKARALDIADTNNDGEIQVSEAEAVEYMFVANQNILSLEGIQSFVNLTYLNCSSNDLTELDLSQNINLIELSCLATRLNEIDLSQNINLVEFYCSLTSITNIDFSHNLDLVKLIVGANPLLTSLDVSLNQALEELHSRSNGLTSLILQNPNLIHLDCSSNQLTTIDVSESPNLEFFAVGNNNLTELDVTQNQNLEVLAFHSNYINTIDTSQNPNLIELLCTDNEVVTLDLSLNPNLRLFSCRNNELTELDFTHNPLLEGVFCDDNELIRLNVQNGNNSVLYYFASFNNPSLNCIQVDDPIAASNNLVWIKDPTASYSGDCTLDINDSEQLKAVIYPNPVHSVLQVQSEEIIKNIQVYDISGNLVFSSEENIDQIDFSNYSNGLYFLKFSSASGNLVEKVLKE